MSVFDTKIDGDSIVEENYTVVYEDNIVKGLLLKDREEITIPQRVKGDWVLFYYNEDWLFREVIKTCLAREVHSFQYAYPVLHGKIDDLKFVKKIDIDNIRDIFNKHITSYKFVRYNEKNFYDFPYIHTLYNTSIGLMGEVHKYISDLIIRSFKEYICISDLVTENFKEYEDIC